jgi:DNA replication and repair protein RecF
MPALKRLVVSGIRNIQPVQLELSPSFNLVSGSNGSGKTSFLEAIHFLSLGRSFRTHLQRPLISEGSVEAVVHGETFDGVSMGVSRTSRKGDSPLLKLNGSKVDGLSVITQELPLQLLNSDVFGVIEGGPQIRRAFMDWGVFHVKHNFLPAWRKAKRALLNRNTLLKQDASEAQIAPWSHELVQYAEIVSKLREEYLQELLAHLKHGMAAELHDRLGADLVLEYFRGWDSTLSLQTLLNSNIGKEKRYGHTLYGPHRADLLLTVGGRPCSEVLSRGQMKVAVSLLKIAQAQLLQTSTGRASIFLVDDLAAELDQGNQGAIYRHLVALNAQTFLTSIEPLQVAAEDQPARRFHVKHGKIISE